MAFINLDDYSQIGSSSAGGKIKNLSLLKSKGFGIAGGFIITDVLSLFNFSKEQIDGFVSNLGELENVKKDDVEAMKNISQKIISIFANLEIKDNYRNEIFKYYNDIFIDDEIEGVSDQIRDIISTGRDKAVIVRPTVFYKNDEENSNYCFSVFESKNHIWKTQLLDAIRQIVVSYFTVHALFYYQTHAIAAKEINFSVLVQQYLQGDNKGSFCLKNPDTGKEEIIIESHGVEEDRGSLETKHILIDDLSDSRDEMSAEEKSIINVATKACSAVGRQDIIVDWIIAKGKVYISNIRKLTFPGEEIYNQQITATAKSSGTFAQNDILVGEKFTKDLLFSYPKASVIILSEEGTLSRAGEIAREMKKRYIDRHICISCKLNARELEGKKLLVENKKVELYTERPAEETSFFTTPVVSSETQSEETHEEFFSKTIIKIPSGLDENNIAHLNEKAGKYRNLFLLEKCTGDENSEHNYFFNYSSYYSNTEDGQTNENVLRNLKIKELFADRNDEATKINQLLGENIKINHYVQFDGLKELILFDFASANIPQYIFINMNAILGELANENLNNQNISKIANLIKSFSIKAKKINKKLIIGISLSEDGKYILRETLFYGDYILIEYNDLDEFEKMHSTIKGYEQKFMFEYIKNQCLLKKE